MRMKKDPGADFSLQSLPWGGTREMGEISHCGQQWEISVEVALLEVSHSPQPLWF